MKSLLHTTLNTFSLLLPLVMIPLLTSRAAVADAADFAFVHPGLLNSSDDLARMKRAVAEKTEPIFSGYEVFRANPQSQSSYRMRGPMAMVGRNPTVGQGDYDSDANAAYQCALMWCLTGDVAYANKAKEIVNAWSSTLKSITGRDAVLMAGLGPFKMVNAAELLRYTNAGWSPQDIARTETHFREVVYPVIKDFAPFANGNWDTAALKTMMAIAVFCNDRAMFERALLYDVDGAGDGRLTHYIINDAGQCQESGRDQQHTQLGLAHLGDCSEIAWHQGLDLYGYANNRLLKGFEYTAKYNLGEDVPFVETLDQTGKYHHTKISEEGRGRFRAVFEQILNHYANRRGLNAPYTRQAVQKVRPEGAGAPSADHVGFGTLLFAQPETSQTSIQATSQAKNSTTTPRPPAGLLAQGTPQHVALSWVASTRAESYIVKRQTSGGNTQIVARNLTVPRFTDTHVKAGALYRYTVSAQNQKGTSLDSLPVSVGAGLPTGWTQETIGASPVAGHTQCDGESFTLEGAGQGVRGTADQLTGAFRVTPGDCMLTARFVPQVASQFPQLGLMMRESTASDAAQISLLLSSEASGQLEAPGWNLRLVSRDKAGSETHLQGTPTILSAPAVTNGRLTGSCWLKLQRSGPTFSAAYSLDGKTWTPVATTTLALPNKLLVGLSAASGIATVPTRVQFDQVTLSK